LTTTGRELTTAGVRWPVKGGLNWLLDAYNVSPDLEAIVQELVDGHNGLAAASHLQFWLRGGQQVNAEVTSPDFKAPGYIGHPATLTITWCL